MFHKLYTLEEANRQLPQIKKIVAEILEKGKRLQSMLAGATPTQINPEAEKLGAQIETLMNNLEARGCFYKDWNFEVGLVDFPALVDGEESFLCWRSDEPEILWFHGIDDGYSGRRPLPAEWLLGDLFKE